MRTEGVDDGWGFLLGHSVYIRFSERAIGFFSPSFSAVLGGGGIIMNATLTVEF